MPNITPIVGKDALEAAVRGEVPVLVDFTAEWCGPCQGLAPVLEKIADEHADELSVVSVDFDENEDLAQSYEVLGLPTLILFDDGEELMRMTGSISKSELMKKLTPFL